MHAVSLFQSSVRFPVFLHLQTFMNYKTIIKKNIKNLFFEVYYVSVPIVHCEYIHRLNKYGCLTKCPWCLSDGLPVLYVVDKIDLRQIFVRWLSIRYHSNVKRSWVTSQ